MADEETTGLQDSTKAEEVDASESIEKMDYPRLVMFQINRIGFLTAKSVEVEKPIANARALEWAVGALEAMVAPYIDESYKDAYDAAIKNRNKRRQDKDADQVSVSVRFQFDKLAHLMRVCDRKGILLKRTYMDRIEPRIIAARKRKGIVEETPELGGEE